MLTENTVSDHDDLYPTSLFCVCTRSNVRAISCDDHYKLNIVLVLYVHNHVLPTILTLSPGISVLICHA